MFVLTIDQRRSRDGADRVPELLDVLNERELRSPFVRTAGDEVQGVAADAAQVIEIVGILLRSESWRCGIGAGEGELDFAPDAPDSRSGRGEAFVHARRALDSIKSSRRSIALRASNEDAAAQGEALLHLIEVVSASRTTRQWEIIDAVERNETMARAAEELGVSQSAVSQAYALAGRREERACYGLLGRLLRECDGGE